MKFQSEISQDQKTVTLSFNCDRCLSFDSVMPSSGTTLDAVDLDLLILNLISVRKKMLPELITKLRRVK